MNFLFVASLLVPSVAQQEQGNVAPSDDARLESLISSLTSEEGHKDAMAELYALIRVPVYSYALSLVKSPQDAEDILHDTLISVHDAAPSYVPKGKPMAWIITIARNHGYGRLRRQKYVADIPDEEWDNYLSEQEQVTPEDRIVLEQCLRALSDTERQIVVMHAVAGMKHRLIAEALELPLSTVLSKYNRALKKLRKNLQLDLP
jgi:RNA polymerase sigma-70 factor (ECF subfamily)